MSTLAIVMLAFLGRDYSPVTGAPVGPVSEFYCTATLRCDAAGACRVTPYKATCPLTLDACQAAEVLLADGTALRVFGCSQAFGRVSARVWKAKS